MSNLNEAIHSKSELDKVCDYFLGNQQKQWEGVMNSNDYFLVRSFAERIAKTIIENIDDEDIKEGFFNMFEYFIEDVIRVNDNINRNGKCDDDKKLSPHSFADVLKLAKKNKIFDYEANEIKEAA